MEQDVNITPENNGASNDTPQTFNVKIGTDANGNPMMQQVTLDELQNGYLRQSDYTRKTQELAKEKEMLTKAQDQGYKGDPSDDEAVELYLQSKGYAKADDLEKIVEQKMAGLTKSQQDEQTLQSILTSNPDLKQFEGAIRKIAATDNSAIEDIVVKYGFSSHDKLSKAKQRDLVGGGNKIEQDGPKPVAQRTAKDREQFESQAKRSQFR